MTPTLPPAWQALLKDELQKPYWCSLEQRLGAAYESGAVYPPAQQLFAAFERTPPACVRAVILGQDPYHEPGQANGLAFSVSRGVKLPPSLQNIYKELEADLGVPAAKSGVLTSWAQQGVFLLNTVLSVRAHAANSHKDFGWQSFTDAVIVALAELPQPVAFVLWGAQAQKKAALVEKTSLPLWGAAICILSAAVTSLFTARYRSAIKTLLAALFSAAFVFFVCVIILANLAFSIGAVCYGLVTLAAGDLVTLLFLLCFYTRLRIKI